MTSAAPSRSFAALSGWATGLAVVEILAVASGLAHARMSVPLAWAVLGISLGAGAAVHRELARGAPARRWRWPRSWEWIVVALGAFAFVLYASLFVAGWAKPELSFDGNTYHSPTIHFWSERGYIHWIRFDGAAGPLWRDYADSLLNAFPKGGEVVAFVLVRAFASSSPVNVFTFAFLPLGMLGVHCIARALGASRPLAIAAALGFLLVPVNISQSNTTYVDAAYASSMIAWLAAVLVGVRRALAREVTWSTTPALASALGLTLATKASGLAPVCLGVAVLAVAAVVAGRRDLRACARSLGVLVAGPLVLGLVVGAYWYARNWVIAGNPLFPVGVSLHGHVIFAGLPVDVVIATKGNTPPSLAALGPAHRVLSAWTQEIFVGGWPDSVRFYDAREGGLGVLWFFGGLPSLLIVGAGAVAARARWMRAELVVLVAITAVAFAAMPMNWWSRYTLWVHGAGLPLVALVATVAFESGRLARIATGAWLALLVAMATRESFVAFRWAATAPAFIAQPRDLRTPRDFWRSLVENDGPWSFYHELRGRPLALEATADDGAVAIAPCTVSELGIVGVLGAPAGGRHLVPLDDVALRDPRALGVELAREHVSWVFYGEHLAPSAALEEMARAKERVDPFWIVYDVRR